MPQGFVCANDQLAYFISKYLIENNYSLPKDIAITGYDGVAEYRNVEGLVATAEVDTATLGRRLATKLIFHLKKPNFINQEISYIKPKVVKYP